MRAVAAILLMAAAAGDSREDVARKLETKVSLSLRGARLADAIEVFRSVTGLNFVTADGAESVVHITLRDVSVRSALRLLLQPLDLGAVLEDGVVMIRNRTCRLGAVVLRIYDVRTLLMKIPDFPGPRIELRGRAAGGIIGIA